MTPGDVRVVFMGSPEFAVPSLVALHEAGYNICLVVSQPDRPAGRGGRLREPAVKRAALERGLPVFQPDSLKDEAAVARLAEPGADVFVVAAYGRILPRSVLALPRRGTVNVHASLLPRWRGASPINAAILAGDAQTGVSIMEVVPKMDAGPVIAQRSTNIRPTETAGELEERLAAIGGELLAETLPRWFDGAISAQPQDEDRVTYCGLISKADGHLAASMTVHEAERAVRAYNPWPGAFVEYRGQRLAIWTSHVSEDGADLAPGAVTTVGRSPAVAFKGGLLVLDEVQRVGARRVGGEAFLNGERGNLPEKVGLRD